MSGGPPTGTLRDELLPIIDEVRGIIVELGFRRYSVTTRRRTWKGGQIGVGSYTDVDTDIVPLPKVQDVPPSLVRDAPGMYEQGDRLVRKISVVSYTRADLDGRPLAAGEEFLWLIDDGSGPTEYMAVGAPEQRNFEWRVQLRRRSGRARP